MSLIIIKSKDSLPMGRLRYEIFRFIYEKDKMKQQDIDFLFSSLKNWTNHFKLKKMQRDDLVPSLMKQEMIMPGAEALEPNDEYRFYCLLRLIGKFLHEDKNLLKIINTHKEHNIDWRKKYFPELITEKDRFLAELALDKAKRENPEEHN